jgi:hypothetical protein
MFWLDAQNLALFHFMTLLVLGESSSTFRQGCFCLATSVGRLSQFSQHPRTYQSHAAGLEPCCRFCDILHNQLITAGKEFFLQLWVLLNLQPQNFKHIGEVLFALWFHHPLIGVFFAHIFADIGFLIPRIFSRISGSVKRSAWNKCSAVGHSTPISTIGWEDILPIQPNGNLTFVKAIMIPPAAFFVGL